MKRLFLLLFSAVFVAGTSFGYDFKKYEGIAFTAMSPDGKLLIYGEEDAGVIIYNTETQEILSYEEGAVEEEYEGNAVAYGVGMGNIANNQGMIVGCYTNRDAAYFLNGTWTPLPGLEGVSKGLYTQGNGVSADGSVICGCVGVGDGWMAMLETGGTSYLPGVWTKQADGTYKCELLPYPTKDFTGRAPQYVTALCISDDGNTIVGQVLGYDGFATYPIVYTRDAEGKWSYKTYGLDYIVKEGVEFPAYPSYEPKYPSLDDYMDSLATAAYDSAYAVYVDSVEMYNNDLAEKYPEYPVKKDFLNPDSAAAYAAANAKFEEEYAAYSDSCDAFDEVYYDAITGASFEYNSVSLSANGKYTATTLEYQDASSEGGFDDVWGSGMIYTPVLFDLSDGTSTQVDATSMQPGSVANDGMMVAATPAVEYSRQAYVIPKGETKPIAFLDWMSTKCDTASIWVKENMAYDMISYVYNDSTEEYGEVTYEDSVQTGTMICNADATIFCAYTFDYWSEESVGFTTYVLDITDPTTPSAIQSISRKGGNVNVAAKNGKISVDGNVANVYVYDMAGRKIADAKGSASVSVNGGLYMVKAVSTDGKVTTKKVSVSR